MIELFKKLRQMGFEEAIEECCMYEGDVKIDIDYNTRTILLTKGSVTIKNDYDYSDKYLVSYSNGDIEGTKKVSID